MFILAAYLDTQLAGSLTASWRLDEYRYVHIWGVVDVYSAESVRTRHRAYHGSGWYSVGIEYLDRPGEGGEDVRLWSAVRVIRDHWNCTLRLVPIGTALDTVVGIDAGYTLGRLSLTVWTDVSYNWESHTLGLIAEPELSVRLFSGLSLVAEGRTGSNTVAAGLKIRI